MNGLIIQCKAFAENAGLDKTLFEALDNHRKFVLNPTSHDSYDVPKFNSEIGGCLYTLKELRKIKNEPFFKRGEQIKFELSNGTDDYIFEIKIEDDFRLLQEPEKHSVISKGIVNYWITKNTEPKGETQHGYENIKSFYDKIYTKSDKTKNSDFWEEIIIVSSGLPLKSKRKF